MERRTTTVVHKIVQFLVEGDGLVHHVPLDAALRLRLYRSTGLDARTNVDEQLLHESAQLHLDNIRHKRPSVPVRNARHQHIGQRRFDDDPILARVIGLRMTNLIETAQDSDRTRPSGGAQPHS